MYRSDNLTQPRSIWQVSHPRPIDKPASVPTVFKKNCDRSLDTEVAAKLMAAALTHPEVKLFVSNDYFSAEGNLV
jgi:hypothetical protein